VRHRRGALARGQRQQIGLADPLLAIGQRLNRSNARSSALPSRWAPSAAS